MAFWLSNANILTPDGFKPDHALLVEGGKVRKITSAVEAAENDTRPSYDLMGKNLVPGFIDIQVNGGGGYLFNDAPTVETLRAIAAAHRPYGTTAMLPTLISDDLSVVERAIEAVDQAILEGVPSIVGIHIEGPFLNPAKKGIHDKSKFRRLDKEAIKLLSSLKHGKTLVTLAPEQTTPDKIKALVAAGIVVSAGHTAASYEETKAALDSGITGFTHLFNAMTGFESRAPGVVGAALEDENSYCGIIADGFHVHPASIKVAAKAKGANKMILVTDAMPCVGAKDKAFKIGGRIVSVTDGKCTIEGGGLAGSDLDMIAACRNAMDFMGIDLATASRMAAENPAKFMGLYSEQGSIAVDKDASFVLLNDAMTVDCVWVKGQQFGELG